MEKRLRNAVKPLLELVDASFRRHLDPTALLTPRYLVKDLIPPSFPASSRCYSTPGAGCTCQHQILVQPKDKVIKDNLPRKQYPI